MMVINRIHIHHFGALHNRDLSVMPGLNIIEGENESGKTTVAAFLRYIFYGVGNNTSISHFLNSDSDTNPSETVGGALDITLSVPLTEYPDITQYRITRVRTRNKDGSAAERCTICPLNGDLPGSPLFTDIIPGERFFGVSEQVFSASAFVGQVNSTAHAKKSTNDGNGNYTGGSPIRSAIDRILYAANEELDPEAAIHALCAKRNALYDPETETGSIRNLERRRAALASSLEAAESSFTELTAEQNDAPSLMEAIPDLPNAEDSEEQRLRLQTELAACSAAIAEKEARIERLQKILDQYMAYRALDDLDTLKTWKQEQNSAEKRAASLAATMFRGNYIPDSDFTASLYLCAEDMQNASEQTAAAKAAMERLDFSVRRDNLKEKQMRRVDLDGGAKEIRSKLDQFYNKRSTVTIFGIIFLLFTVFAAAITVFLLVLHSTLNQNAILVTAILGALAFFFFLSRGKYERSIGVLLKRYNCTTEDELENFLEEHVISKGKLDSLTENKETLAAKMSEQSLHGSEAARQAALLLSKLQPPDTAKITADRLTPQIVTTAAERIDRTLGELNRLYQTADDYRDKIAQYLSEHHAQNEETLIARKKTLAAFFDKNDTPFDPEPMEQDLILALTAVTELHEKREAMQTYLTQPITEITSSTAASAPTKNFRKTKASDYGPDPAILRALIAEMDEVLRRDRKQYAALNLAIDAIRDASTALHRSIAPRLIENAGKLMALLSDHRYSALLLDDTMHLRAAQNDSDNIAREMPLDILSAGTQDLAYLSLRMALLHMLYRHELPPLLFDEAFSTLDDKRLSRMIALLHRASTSEQAETNTSQAIVFTCHKRERRSAQAIAPCHVLKL